MNNNVACLAGWIHYSAKIWRIFHPRRRKIGSKSWCEPPQSNGEIALVKFAGVFCDVNILAKLLK